jgi:hypothetical protein
MKRNEQGYAHARELVDEVNILVGVSAMKVS